MALDPEDLAALSRLRLLVSHREGTLPETGEPADVITVEAWREIRVNALADGTVDDENGDPSDDFLPVAMQLAALTYYGREDSEGKEAEARLTDSGYLGVFYLTGAARPEAGAMTKLEVMAQVMDAEVDPDPILRRVWGSLTICRERR